MKQTTFEIRTNSGKRVYSLWLDTEDYHNSITITNNKVMIYAKEIEINKNSHKDWSKAFNIDKSNEYYTIIEFKKGFISIEIDRIDKWCKNRSLVMIEGSKI